MKKRREIDKKQLLSNLEELAPEKKQQGLEDLMRRVSMSSALPALTEINHENEYQLTREVAGHLIGKIHEPETGDL
jgi:hypothetical protein